MTAEQLASKGVKSRLHKIGVGSERVYLLSSLRREVKNAQVKEQDVFTILVNGKNTKHVRLSDVTFE